MMHEHDAKAPRADGSIFPPSDPCVHVHQRRRRFDDDGWGGEATESERRCTSWRSASFSADPSLDRTGIESQAKVIGTHTKYIVQCSKAIDR